MPVNEKFIKTRLFALIVEECVYERIVLIYHQLPIKNDAIRELSPTVRGAFYYTVLYKEGKEEKAWKLINQLTQRVEFTSIDPSQLIIHDTYLDRGGFGNVYKGEYLDKTVAVKVLEMGHQLEHEIKEEINMLMYKCHLLFFNI